MKPPIKPKAAGAVVQTMQMQAFVGPIPPPDVMEEYNRVLPGAAERILAMAENQLAHRQRVERLSAELESKKLDEAARESGRAFRDSILNRMLSFMTAVAFLATSIFMIHSGLEWQGVLLILAEIAALVAAFLKANKSQG
jgi:uncharacterized membrane protein